jgi:hypothetical protein
MHRQGIVPDARSAIQMQDSLRDRSTTLGDAYRMHQRAPAVAARRSHGGRAAVTRLINHALVMHIGCINRRPQWPRGGHAASVRRSGWRFERSPRDASELHQIEAVMRAAVKRRSRG